MKKLKKKDEFLAELRKIPIIQVACEKVGLSRTSVYRWKDEDPEFKKEMEQAMADGEAFVNDMGESQLLTLIKEKNWSAIMFWLRHHHPAYANKIEVKHTEPDEAMNQEQFGYVETALKMRAEFIKQNYESNNNTSRINRENGEGQKSTDSDN